MLERENFTTHQQGSDDILYIHKLPNGGRITILDRLTGYDAGLRDIESGYSAPDGKFWLASGNFDIRTYIPITINAAIELIVQNANTCKGE